MSKCSTCEYLQYDDCVNRREDCDFSKDTEFADVIGVMETDEKLVFIVGVLRSHIK
jgi:ATP-dependent Zn protease